MERRKRMNALQLRLAGMALRIEIRTYYTSKMQMTREPAMKIITRLMGFDAYKEFGKGLQGRNNAFEWVNETLELNGLETLELT
tara:strand:- start:551 stop:802 length:252 start_codon:yes stop_codon:yes gene_type:complete